MKHIITLGILSAVEVLLISTVALALEKVNWSKDDISQVCNERNYRNYIIPGGKEYRYNKETNKPIVYEKWKGCDLEHINLDGVVLSGANLSGANLVNTALRNANLSEASLINANLTYAHLNEAVLKKANLYKANLVYAQLPRAHLDEANLQEANLKDANLYQAYLLKTDLRGTDLDGANLKGAKYLSSIICNGDTNFPGWDWYWKKSYAPGNNYDAIVCEE